MPKIIDYTGLKFNRLTALKYHHSANGYVYWIFQCNCGKKTVKIAQKVKTGHTKSCGCLYGVKKITHGDTIGGKIPRLYKIWAGLKQRCNNEKDHHYKNYGGRGITVFEEWNEYITFKKWAYKNGYKENLTIERIDNNGNYEPDNCCFIKPEQQALNKRNLRLITFDDRTQSISRWSNEMKINYGTLYGRLNKFKWSIERALTSPVRRKRINI